MEVASNAHAKNRGAKRDLSAAAPPVQQQPLVAGTRWSIATSAFSQSVSQSVKLRSPVRALERTSVSVLLAFAHAIRRCFEGVRVSG